MWAETYAALITDRLATRDDVTALRHDMDREFVDVRGDIAAMRGEIAARIAHSQLATIVILSTVMGRFSCSGDAGRKVAEAGVSSEVRAYLAVSRHSPPCASSLSRNTAPAKGPSGPTATSRIRPISPSRMTRSDAGRPSSPISTR